MASDKSQIDGISRKTVLINEFRKVTLIAGE
jgi:hypothetical protein